MAPFLDDLEIDPEERRAARREFIELAEEEQIAEGDISVSETVSGHDPTPDIDDRQTAGEVLGEDELRVLDEDDPELAFSYDLDDDYLVDDDDDDDDDE